ncbi:MAG: glycosyltransferase family 2 protein [Aureispira sp.]|nr:glycosyltransferase family 2 protein [Aureispira sp.]
MSTTQKDYPSVAIVILNWNGEGFLRKFLPSVYQSKYPNLSLYVADNGSSDESLAFLEKEGFQYQNSQDASSSQRDYPRYIIKLPENYGFAQGYNLALKQVEADYYILLNSDVEVSPNWIQPVIDLMEKDPQVAACQPKIKMQADKKLFEHAGASGGWIDKFGYPFCRGRIFFDVEKDNGQYDDAQEVFWASGAALFIRGSLFHQIGGFDGDFFAHMEEIDLCWRLKRANYKIMVQPASQVWHVGGGTLPVTSPRKAFLNFRNSLTMVFKNESKWRMLWVIWVRLILDGVAGVRFLMKGEFANIGSIIKAHWQFFFGIPKHIKKRKRMKVLVQKYAYQQNPKMNMIGRYPKSIISAYFLGKKQTFKSLNMNSLKNNK